MQRSDGHSDIETFATSKNPLRLIWTTRTVYQAFAECLADVATCEIEHKGKPLYRPDNTFGIRHTWSPAGPVPASAVTSVHSASRK